MKKHKMSLLGKIGLFLVSSYRVLFSLWLGGTCRFYPSCSCYASLVYQKYPFFKASLFIFKRLLNCHPLGPSWRNEPEIQEFLVKK